MVRRIFELMFQTVCSPLLECSPPPQRKTTVRNVSSKILLTMMYNLSVYNTTFVETPKQHSTYEEDVLNSLPLKECTLVSQSSAILSSQ